MACCVILCCEECPATDVHSALRCITQWSTECTSVAGHSSQHNITQHGMLPQHPTCTKKSICDYLYCDFSKAYTGCPRRNMPDFGWVFLMLRYTDITQNTYVQSWTVTEIMAREKCGLHAGPHTVPVSWQSYQFLSLSVVSYDDNSAHARHRTACLLLSGCSAVYRSVVNSW